MTTDVDVAVVGAGIAGLTAAHELARAGLEVRVFESTDHVGGRMASLRHGGYTVDTGAEQIPTHGYRATWQLLRRLGFQEDEVPLIGKPISVWRDGRAHSGVAELRGIRTGAGLSPRARWDLARFMGWAALHRREFQPEYPERTPLGGATIAELTSRYHPDLHDYLFQPVAGSFFGWDTTRSAAAVMACLLLTVGDASSWRTYRDGMDTLALRLADQLPVELGRTVDEVVAERDTARVRIGSDEVTARSVLLCVPAPLARRLYANAPGEEAEFLSVCTFTPALKVSCLLDRPLVPEGDAVPYALLTPQVEDGVLSAIIFDDQKNPRRSPEGGGLLTLMANARTIPRLIDAPDHQVIERLTGAVPRYLPRFREANRENHVHRFRFGLPEATPKALYLRERFAHRPISAVDYAGDWVMLRPASEGAVQSSAIAASRVLSRLRSTVPDRTAGPTRTVGSSQ